MPFSAIEGVIFVCFVIIGILISLRWKTIFDESDAGSQRFSLDISQGIGLKAVYVDMFNQINIQQYITWID